MLYFLCRLNPPRPTFMVDMSEDEKRLMQTHAAYWTELLNRGTALIFGPVADPKGGWGVSILAVESEAELRRHTSNDPVIRSGLPFSYETYSMPRAIVGRSDAPCP